MIKSNLKSIMFALALTLLGSTTAFAAEYKVKSGDSLYKISKAYNTTSDVLIKNNSLSSSMIYPGQILNVPANTHKVASGDTLYIIAKKYGISLDALRQANNKWNNLIYPGEILKIPFTTSSGGQTSSGVIPYSTSDVDLLARLIMAEAGGESYTAMVSVGAVVVNRVQSSQFTNSISGVIYDKSYGYYQFTPVANGMIYKPASETAKKAAYEVLKGTDPTKGALYFYDSSATNKWLTSKPTAAVFGELTFAY